MSGAGQLLGNVVVVDVVVGDGVMEVAVVVVVLLVISVSVVSSITVVASSSPTTISETKSWKGSGK